MPIRMVASSSLSRVFLFITCCAVSSQEGYTALMQCSWYGVSGVSALLMKRGAGINTTNDVSAALYPIWCVSLCEVALAASFQLFRSAERLP